jgi:hypothetical protein
MLLEIAADVVNFDLLVLHIVFLSFCFMTLASFFSAKAS